MKNNNYFSFYVLFWSCFVFIEGVASVNDSPARNIQVQLAAGIQSSPAASFVTDNMNRLQETPGSSMTFVLQGLTMNLIDDLAGERGSLVDRNDQVYDSFTSPDKSIKRKATVLNDAARRLSDSDRGEISVVNTEHVTRPKIKKNKVSGGHWIANYAPGQVSTQCFLGQDQHTLGVFVGSNYYPKTVRRDFNSSVVLNTLRGSYPVAQDCQFVISRTADNAFISSFRNDEHVLRVDTLFPVLVVDPKRRDIDGDIVLGTFGELSLDYNNILNRENAKISPADYNKMISHGMKLDTYPGDPIMVDITSGFQRRFSNQLKSRGFDKGRLPGKLYGYGRAE